MTISEEDPLPKHCDSSPHLPGERCHDRQHMRGHVG